MKKGHRRTNSQTIGMSRPFQPKTQTLFQNQPQLFQPKFEQQIISSANPTYPSIQSLLEKSEHHIARRVLYIENLQQPNNIENSNNEFSFGKGVNYKLTNFKLNMGEIPEVPKSNQSTSLQGQNKIETLEKQLYFHQDPIDNLPLTQDKPNKQSKVIKFLPKHLKTSSAVGMKKYNKIEKSQKPEVIKNQIKSFHQIQFKDNHLQRPKIEFQIQKKLPSTKNHNQVAHHGLKHGKQILTERLGIEAHKKKKNTLFK